MKITNSKMSKPYDEIKKIYELKQKKLINELEYEELKTRQLKRWGLELPSQKVADSNGGNKSRSFWKTLVWTGVSIVVVLLLYFLWNSNLSTTPSVATENYSEIQPIESKEIVPQENEEGTSLKNNPQQSEKISKVSPTSMRIEAYLIYEDQTIGNTDILLGTSSLWNVIIGEGSAEKPSTRTRIVVTVPQNPQYKNIIITAEAIPNINYTREGLSSVNGEMKWTFDLDDTGCNPIDIRIWINNDLFKEAMIPYECGE